MFLIAEEQLVCYLIFWKSIYSHGQNFWDTFAFLGRFPIHTGPTPPLTPQTMLDACIQNFFRVSTLYRVEGERTARKFRKGCNVLWGNPEITESSEYCNTVPRTLVACVIAGVKFTPEGIISLRKDIIEGLCTFKEWQGKNAFCFYQ